MSLGNWLTPKTRDGKAFLILPSVVAKPERFQDFLDEAFELRRLTRLYVVVDVAAMCRIVINPLPNPKERTQIVNQWDILRKSKGAMATKFIGIPYETAYNSNHTTRRSRLTKAPAMAMRNQEVRRETVSASLDKPLIKLAERWARFMQPMLDGRITTQDAVFASLYLADENGYLNPNRLPAALRHLQKFWPHYEATIGKVFG